MVRESKNKIFLILIMLAVLVFITGCGSSNTAKKYYTGYNSVEMRFLEDTPPTTMFYDSQADINNFQENTIPINVELYNKGSSNSYGALFIHGFDPNIVAVAGYTNTYPLYSGVTRGGNTAVNGWYTGSGDFAFGATGLQIGNSMVNFGASDINGKKVISFSTFSMNNAPLGTGFGSRSNLFLGLNFQSRSTGLVGQYSSINDGVIQARIGAVLNPITRQMMNNFGWTGWLQNFELEGRNPNNPAGGMTVIEFPATILSLPPSLEEFRQRIMVTSCFDYVTHASSMVCIDPEPYSNVKKACKPQTVSLGGGQGAPVAITSIEQRPGRGRTTFVINVHHTKKGTYDELYDYFSLYKCDPASGEVVKTNDKNIVYVGYVYLSNYDITMTCIPDQVIRLDDSGNGQITCSVEFPKGADDKVITTSAYEAPMEVELWYGYSKTIYKDVNVKRI